MNCVERVRRENSMLASFLTDAKAFLDASDRVVVRLRDAFSLMMLDNPAGKDALCRAIAPEVKKMPTPGDILLEIPDPKENATDTVLDDLLEAANDQND